MEWTTTDSSSTTSIHASLTPIPYFQNKNYNQSVTKQNQKDNLIWIIKIKVKGMREPLNNRGAQEALEVATARKLEARNNFLGDGGATDDVAALKDSNWETGAGEVGGGSEAIVTTANDKRVPFLLRQGACGLRRRSAGVQVPAMLSPHSLSRWLLQCYWPVSYQTYIIW